MKVLLDETVFILEIVHDILDPQLAAAELPADFYDLLDTDLDAEDGVHRVPDTFFDLFGNLYFSLPAQEGHHSHLPEVHLHGIAGFTHYGHQAEEVFILASGQFVRRFLYDQLFTFVRIDDIDVLLPEKHDDIVDLIGRNDVRRQKVVDVVIG